MAAISTTGTLTAGSSKTFNLAPGAAVSLTLSPNPRVTITETPESVSGSGVGGNTTRVHEPQLPGTFAYGPYAMGGVVVVAVASNSGSSVAWTRKDTVVTTSSDGTSLVSGDGSFWPVLQDYAVKRAPYGLALIEPPVSGITTATGASCTINSSAATVRNGETVWTVNATATNTTNNWFEVQIPTQSQAFAASDMTAEFALDDFSKLDSGGIVYYLGTAGYSIFSTGTINSQITPSTSAPFALNGLTAQHIREPQWTKSGYTDEVGNQAWVNSKIRVFITNGQTVTFSLRAIRYAAMRKKGRIAIVSDDGYASWHKMGVPIMREYGFKTSNAIIYDALGTSDKTNLATLQAYVAEGNECIGHGPNDGTGGTGSLFTTWTTNAQRIADINACRDYLLANNLCTMWGARSYVWPQGQYTNSASDLELLGLMIANGYRAARGALVPTTFYMHKTNAVSSSNLSSFVTPIVGHTWASAGTEAANIAGINAKIAATAVARADCTLMLHRVVGPDAAAASTEISSNRLRQICDAIKAEVDAGNMEVVLYSEFAK